MLEEVHDVVVADVDQPEKLPLRDERRHHDGAQLQVEDALTRVEHRVVDGVTDDERLPRVDALSKDAVRELSHGVRNGLPIDVARRSDLGIAISKQNHETFVRVHDLDDRVEESLDLVGNRANLEQPAIEVAQLHHPFDFGPVLRCGARLDLAGRALVVEREDELHLAERELVVVEDLRLLLPLSVHQELGARIDRAQREVPSVENELRVVGLERWRINGDIVRARPSQSRSPACRSQRPEAAPEAPST